MCFFYLHNLKITLHKMQNLTINKYVFVYIFLSSIFSLNLFSQKELRQLLDKRIGQQTQISDSLMNLIVHTKDDTLRFDLYFQYLENVSNKERKIILPIIIRQVDSILKHTKVSALMRKSLLNRKGQSYQWYAGYYEDTEGSNSKREIECLNNAINAYKEAQNAGSSAVVYIDKANCFFRQGKLMKQLETLQEGLHYEITQKHNKGIARFYLNLQLFYADIGDTSQAMNYIKKSLEINTAIGDSAREARGYYLTGLTYGKLNQSQLAIESYLKSLELYKKEYMDGRERIFQVYGELANEYAKLKEYNKAFAVYENLEAEGVKRNEIAIIFKGTMGKGSMKSMLCKHDEAIKIHSDILKLAEQANETKGGVGRAIYTALAEDYYRANNYNNARNYMNLALSLSDNDPLFHKYYLQELAFKIDSASENYEGAFKHFYQLHKLKELINKEDVAKSLAKEQFTSDLNEFKREQEKQDIVSEQEKNKQRIILNSVLVVVFILILLALVIFRNLSKTRKANKIIAEQKKEVEYQKFAVEQQKHIVEEKQKEIIESITYAKRLQEAILPPQEFINKFAPDNFVLYKPKDLVAGDFYWAEKKNDLFFMAAADSTGHGVPGAMVSVVCSNALNRTVKEFNLTETGKILDKTRELVLETFEKSTSEVKDGMDISLLCIDLKNKIVFWSGANNPLWYIQDNELIEIKADKQQIGKTEYPKPFTTHQIEYKINTTFYLFTDGFADQFGGPKGKKFKYKQFSELLVTNTNLTQQQQAETIDKAFEDWKGNLEQVDDVCVIGIKI